MVLEAQADSSEERRASVFISYSREDKDFVRRLDQALAKRQRATWVDLEDIKPTEEWLASVYSGIEGASAFVFVISPESVESKSCLQELAHAVDHNKRLVPIVRREVGDSAVPEPLRALQWIYFRDEDDFEEAFQELVEALDTDLDWAHAHTRLLTRAIEWDGNGRDNSFVLRGNDLRTAEEWQVRAAEKEPKLTTLQTEYLLASRKDLARRQRLRLIGVAFAMVVAIVLGSIAFWQRNVAEDQRKEAIQQRNVAIGRELAAQSQLVMSQGNNFQLSMLLGVEATRRSPSLEADQALRLGLALVPRNVSTLTESGAVQDIEFSPDGRYVASASDDGTARVSEAVANNEVSTLKHDDAVTDVDFSPDGKYVASASYDGTARVWDAATGKEISSTKHFSVVSDLVYDVDFSPDGRYVASAFTPGTATVWEAATGKEVSTLKHDEEFHHVDFSPNGRYVADASWGTVEVWDAATGREVSRMEHGDKTVNAVDFSPDGRYVASASWDGTARVWNAVTGKEVSRMQHDGRVTDVEFSPKSGKYVVSASADGTARVWDAATGREVSRMHHGDAVNTADFSPKSGRYLPTALVNAVAFSPDGRYVASASYDETARIWYWQPKDMINETCRCLTRNLSMDEWHHYLPDEPYRKTCPDLPEPE